MFHGDDYIFHGDDKGAFPNKGEWSLSKREYFAAMAMQGFISNSSMIVDVSKIVRTADELLKELAK